MKTIPLSKGKVALVDDEDYERVNALKWYFNRYAIHDGWDPTNKKTRRIFMHRLIMHTPVGYFTDHISSNKLDNRKANLRLCTKSENMHNRPAQVNNTSGYKNIYRDKTRQLWSVEVKVKGKKHHIGRFEQLDEAIKARDKAYRDIVGSFAWQK